MMRLRDVPTGTHILITGLEFRVRRSDTEILLKRLSGGKAYGNLCGQLRYGLNCQMYVEVVERVKKDKPMWEKIADVLKEDWHTISEVAKKMNIHNRDVACRMYVVSKNTDLLSIPYHGRTKKYHIENK